MRRPNWAVEYLFAMKCRAMRIGGIETNSDIEDIKLSVIFCATKMMVDELTDHLVARGYSADKLHGDISQAAREKVMLPAIDSTQSAYSAWV